MWLIGQAARGGEGLVVAQVHCDDGAPAAEQKFHAALADLPECAGHQNRIGRGHFTTRRAAFMSTLRTRSEMYTETTVLKISSRSRVSLELVMRHWPSAFS